MPPVDPDLAGQLLTALRQLGAHPAARPERLPGALAALLRFAGERGLLGPEAPSALPLREAARALLDGLTGPAPELSSPPGQLTRERLFHPCIHVDPHRAFFSFFSADAERPGATRLLALDRSGALFPTAELGPLLPHPVAALEREAAACPALLADPPELLCSAAGRSEALQRLRDPLPAELPFASPQHLRRLRVWCLMTYLFPVVPRTPFLRVRVPDIRSARHVEELLERSCWNALAVHRGDMTARIARHRRVFAGTVIVGPEIKSGRLPRAALDLLEDLPATRHLEPPVAFVEHIGGFLPPRVPEGWIVDVTLAAPVPPVELPDDWRHLGCALALARDGGLLRKALGHEGGVAEWLHRWLFNALPSAAEDEADGFPLRSGGLAEQVEQVWAACVAESDGAPPALQCNAPCLHERLLARFPDRPGRPGYRGSSAYLLRRQLVDRGVATFGVRNLQACLSKPKTEEWRRRNVAGVEVPVYRLPAGTVVP